MRILFLARSLDSGGAERQLVILARGLRQRGHDVTVLVFYSGGPLEAELIAAGVPLASVSKRSRWEVLAFFQRLVHLVRESSPDVLYSYLPVPNVFGVFLKPFHKKMRLVWGVRASNIDLTKYDGLTRFSYKFERLLARFPDLIVCNSYAARDHVLANEYPPDKTIVIQNGIATDQFRFDEDARGRMREAWGLASAKCVIGMVARLDPVKGHVTFIEAAAKLADERKSIRFVSVGGGSEEYLTELRALVSKAGLEEQFTWVNSQTNMSAVYSALDVACLTSQSEGFPNVVAEAMACGRPCIVTDVGDSSLIVGDEGIVIPPGDSGELLAAFRTVLDEDYDHPNRQERRRRSIMERFSTTALVESTERSINSIK